MEEGEYVETSDPEEHEILSECHKQERTLHHSSPLRKRIKLDHRGYFSSPVKNVHNAHLDATTLSTSYSPASQVNFLSSTPEHSFISESPTPLKSPVLSQPGEFDLPLDDLGEETVNAHLRSSGNEQTQTSDAVIQDSNPSDIYNTPRYSFRRRAIAQIKPYTVDKLQYKHALSANPDAIVTNRELKLAGHDQADGLYNKSQALWDPNDDIYHHNDDDSGLQAKRRSNPRQRLGYEEDHIFYPDILQDLPLTDEEEESSLQATSKEARKAIRRLRLSSAQRMDEGDRRPKPFPARNLGLTEPYAAATRTSSLTLNHSRRESTEEHSTFIRAHTPLTSIPYPPLLLDEISSTDPRPLLPLSADNEDEVANKFETEADRQSLHSLSDPGTSQEPGSDVESNDSHDSSSEMTKEQYKQFKTLSRLYPRFMVEKLLNGSSRSATRRPEMPIREPSSDDDDDDDDDVELLPGQARTKWTKRSWNLQPRDVKGDEDGSDSGRSQEETESRFVASPMLQSGWDHPEILDLTASSEENSDIEVDDSRIQSYLSNNLDILVPRGGGRREESLIDYMLAGTRRVGATRSSKTRTRFIKAKHKNGPEPRYKTDIVVGGANMGRQTQLGVDHRILTEGGRARKTSVVGSRRRQSGAAELSNGVNDSRPEQTLDTTKKGSQKAKRRGRVGDDMSYTFESRNIQVVSGRRGNGPISVDTEDYDFHQAIAPLSQDRTFSPTQATSTKPKPHISHDVLPHSPYHYANNGAPLQPTRQLIRDDFNIQVFRSGISFGINTYIGKGMLHELISVIKSKDPPRMPGVFVFHDVEFGPTTSIGDFSEHLERIFDLCIQACSVSAEVRGDSRDRQDLFNATNQMLSWLLTGAAELEASGLRNVVREQAFVFVSRMRDLAIQASSIDVFTLSACWFSVELFARADLMSLSATSDSPGQPIGLLVDYLMDYGMERTISSIIVGVTLDSSTTAQYAAELWVSLFHLTDSLSDTTRPSMKPMHPFWVMVKGAVESERSTSKSNFEASEWMWHSIFCLCALSQFSIHGMTTGVPRLPACWELVASALKRIRLYADPSVDKFLPIPSLSKRDKYISFITNRCFYLWNRWHWELNDASVILTQLVEIFRSRKFAGLRHERPEYPSFLVKNNWALLSKHEPDEAAFTLFLKLLAQAALCDTPSSKGTLPPKIKKLLSMTTPVGSLPFSRKTATSLQDLSMLYNRLGAIAVGIHLDPTHHASRILQAQSYVNFPDADETTRLAVIRGMLYLAVLVKNARLPMDGFKAWIENIGGALIDDYRALHSPEGMSAPEAERNILQDRLGCYAQTLARAVYQIIVAYENSEYPEPLLLTSLLPIYKAPQSFTDVPTTTEGLRQVLQAFLYARRAALPRPQLPRSVRSIAQESQESQDEYGILEMDYDDPIFLAALGVEEEKQVSPDFAAKEEAIKTAMDDCFVWWAWRNLNKALDPGSSIMSSTFRLWLDCWLGCVEVSVQAGGKTWKQFLDLTKQWKLPDSRNRQVSVDMWMRVLILDPMTFLDNTDGYIEIFMMALVSPRPILEHSFTQLVLSIAGDEHPLLTGLRKYQTGDLIAERKILEILQVVLNNLAYCLRQVAIGNKNLTQDCEKYIGFCIKMFQSMKDNFSDLENGSERQKYLDLRSEIFGMIGKYVELRTHPRLAHWIGWGRGVD